MPTRVKTILAACVIFAVGLLVTDAVSRRVSSPDEAKKARDLQRAFVLDGSPVHDAGNLRLHVGNWGAFGSRPGSVMGFAHAPSAEYPAGSGVEYLYDAGLWVGAIKRGIPAVSTGAYEWEFGPTLDPLDVVYYAAENDPGGMRLPQFGADDDRDGRIDEEWLDGRDNDCDGKIDEDFAAISDQMLNCWYTDDQPRATEVYPTHNPLHLLVRQRSMQWSDPRFDDFVCFEYTITNTGYDELKDVYLGMFVDGDAGSRTTDNYYYDDICGYNRVENVCTEWGAVDVEYAYIADDDGDGGLTTAQCGVVLIDHTTDPSGLIAPTEVRFTSFHRISGGQDDPQPTNDFERYELMSSNYFASNGTVPRDYSYLVCVGPFPVLSPGQSLEFKIALFAGDASGGDDTEVIQNAAAAKIIHRGQWFNLDGNLKTGAGGRETPVSGPAADVVVDACADPPVTVPIVYPGQTVWTNADCAEEVAALAACGYNPDEYRLYRTGVYGNETQINWLLPATPVIVTNFAAYLDFNAGSASATAFLEWELTAEQPIMGFRVYRTSKDEAPAILPSRLGMLPPGTRSFADMGVNAGRSYSYTLVTLMEDGSAVHSGRIETARVPWSATLHQNFPNPFNPGTTISFTLTKESRVNLSVYTLEGKRIVTLVDGTLAAGNKYVPWDGRDEAGGTISTGMYFYRLKTGNETLARKMILLR